MNEQDKPESPAPVHHLVGQIRGIADVIRENKTGEITETIWLNEFETLHDAILRISDYVAMALRKADINHLQQSAIDAGFKYWRASDAHGVTGTKEQAEQFIADLIGVEVEIRLPNAEDHRAQGAPVNPLVGPNDV